VTLRVALNMLHLVPAETGGSELYARRLVPALMEAGPKIELTVIASRRTASSLRDERWSDEIEIVGLPFDARSRARRVLAEQTLLPRELRRRRVDLLHNLYTTAPAAPGVPQVTTILDVIYRRFPATHEGVLGRGLAALVWMAARRSQRVIAISEAGKTDIVRFLGVPVERVDVTHLGPALGDEETTPESDLRRELDLGNAPIVLTVSAKRPHKNLERLFEGFKEVDGDSVLVAPGYSTFYEDELRKKAGDRIRLTGWLPDAQLDGLYRAATCFVFPSLAEGFGLPVLDALVRGTPVACSNATSLPEVAGDAALYFDPQDRDAITAAIERLLADEPLRERLREAGLRQAAKFSWRTTAESTLASYERVRKARAATAPR
jgi:glycosyltransferase involved in cell wall biosynthesis